MRFPSGVTVTVLRSGGRDSRGNPRPDIEHRLDDWAVAPRSSDEATDRADTAITGAVARGPYNDQYTAIGGLRSTDRLRVPTTHPMAGTWQVDGEPGPWRSPFSGWTPGVRVALTRSS